MFNDLKFDSSSKLSQYRELRCIYKGEGRAAHLCHSLKDDSLVILKRIWIKSISSQEGEEAVREAEILKLLNHPNIIKFRDFFMVGGQYLCLVMDYADGGDLYQKIRSSEGPIPENQILDWTTQICLALKHMHDRKIIHRDIKSSNIFLTSMNIVKVGDFGISSSLGHTNDFLKSFAGTYIYLSPEILQNQPYNAKTDVWSLGVVLYELCALVPPFLAPKNDRRELETKIKAGSYKDIPLIYSRELRELLRDMLTTDPAKRPSINEILKRGIVKNRVRIFLNESQFVDEFSHTVIHNRQFLPSSSNLPDNEVHADSPQPRRRKEQSPSTKANLHKKAFKILSDEKFSNVKDSHFSLVLEPERRQNSERKQVMRKLELVPASRKPPAGGAQSRPTPPLVRESADNEGESREKRKKFFEKIEFLKKELSQPECFRDSANFAKDQLKKVTSLEHIGLPVWRKGVHSPPKESPAPKQHPTEKESIEYAQMLKMYKGLLSESLDSTKPLSPDEKIKEIYFRVASRSTGQAPMKLDEICKAILDPSKSLSDSDIAQFMLSTVFKD